MGDLNKRRGIIQSNEAELDDAVLGAHVPLAEMFGYSTALRSMTQVYCGRSLLRLALGPSALGCSATAPWLLVPHSANGRPSPCRSGTSIL